MGTYKSHPIVVQWLQGMAVELDGKVYVFPHGVQKMRKLIYDVHGGV